MIPDYYDKAWPLDKYTIISLLIAGELGGHVIVHTSSHVLGNMEIDNY